MAPESVAVGEEANITCSLYNTGRIKLYNVKAKFEGEGLTGKEVFVGNIEPGATGSIDGIVTANQEMDETKKCKVVISYEDEAGKSASMEKEFPPVSYTHLVFCMPFFIGKNVQMKGAHT